jgi:hypothetical protein
VGHGEVPRGEEAWERVGIIEVVREAVPVTKG